MICHVTWGDRKVGSSQMKMIHKNAINYYICMCGDRCVFKLALRYFQHSFVALTTENKFTESSFCYTLQKLPDFSSRLYVVIF